MTSLEEIRDIIVDTEHGEWIPFNDMGTWTYKDRVQLRIHRHDQLDANFQAPWTQHLQANSQSFGYVVYWGNSPVEYHTIVSVDNFRAHIPFPQQPQATGGSYTITPYQATIGRIITGDDQTFDAYLNNTGVQVQE